MFWIFQLGFKVRFEMLQNMKSVANRNNFKNFMIRGISDNIETRIIKIWLFLRQFCIVFTLYSTVDYYIYYILPILHIYK